MLRQGNSNVRSVDESEGEGLIRKPKIGMIFYSILSSICILEELKVTLLGGNIEAGRETW